MIPYDKQKPAITSGVRIGTPCVTTRGMKEPEMVRLGEMIVKALKNIGDSAENAKAREEVAADVLKLTSEFPVYA